MPKPTANSTKIQLINYIFITAGLTCLITGCISLIRENPTLATTGLTAGLALLIFASIERFESIKGLGMEAKTRELAEKIGEAKHAVTELKQLAEITGHNLSLLAARVGRWDSAFSFTEGHELAKKIRENLSSLNCNDDSIKNALHPWIEITIKDLARYLAKNTLNATHNKRDELNNLRHEIPQPIAPSNQEFVTLTQRINTITAHIETYNNIHKCRAAESYALLQLYITSAPETDPELKKAELANLHSWKEKIDHLILNCEIISLESWKGALEGS